MIAYAIGQTLTGKLMDAVGTRIGFTVAIVGWSISIAPVSYTHLDVYKRQMGTNECWCSTKDYGLRRQAHAGKSGF